jgi:hypothetical protein
MNVFTILISIQPSFQHLQMHFRDEHVFVREMATSILERVFDSLSYESLNFLMVDALSRDVLGCDLCEPLSGFDKGRTGVE